MLQDRISRDTFDERPQAQLENSLSRVNDPSNYYEALPRAGPGGILGIVHGGDRVSFSSYQFNFLLALLAKKSVPLETTASPTKSQHYSCEKCFYLHKAPIVVLLNHVPRGAIGKIYGGPEGHTWLSGGFGQRDIRFDAEVYIGPASTRTGPNMPPAAYST